MRILHTSDWHAGRYWKGRDRLPEFQDVLEHLGDFIERERIEGAGLRSAMPTEADGYFRAHRFDTSKGPVVVPAGFSIIVVLEGDGVLVTSAGSMEVARGDVALVPFAAGDVTLHDRTGARMTGVVCRPPAVDAPTDVR